MSINRIFFCLVTITLVTCGLLLSGFPSFPGFDAGEREAAKTADAATNSDGASFRDGVVTAAGVGKISSKIAASRELARRAALTDARRNLLIEALRIRDGITGKPSVSGHVGYHWIVSERREGYLYRVVLAARLVDIRVERP
jgi:hypothetical protein